MRGASASPIIAFDGGEPWLALLKLTIEVQPATPRRPTCAVSTRKVGIKRYSAFAGEEEYLLRPGTQLLVVDVKSDKSGLWTVKLEELAGAGLVS